jgi:hypothetical protein
VRAARGPLQPASRGDIDDDASALLNHGRYDRLHAKDHAEEVDPEDGAPQFRGRVEDSRARKNSRIVDEAEHGAIDFARGLARGVHLTVVRDIDFSVSRFAAVRGALGSRCPCATIPATIFVSAAAEVGKAPVRSAAATARAPLLVGRRSEIDEGVRKTVCSNC